MEQICTETKQVLCKLEGGGNSLKEAGNGFMEKVGWMIGTSGKKKEVQDQEVTLASLEAYKCSILQTGT